MEFRRRIYRRGSSFETTLPMPLLLTLDSSKRHDCCFTFDPEKQVWQIRFEERRESESRSATARQLASNEFSGDDALHRVAPKPSSASIVRSSRSRHKGGVS